MHYFNEVWIVVNLFPLTCAQSTVKYWNPGVINERGVP